MKIFIVDGPVADKSMTKSGFEAAIIIATEGSKQREKMA